PHRSALEGQRNVFEDGQTLAEIDVDVVDVIDRGGVEDLVTHRLAHAGRDVARGLTPLGPIDLLDDGVLLEILTVDEVDVDLLILVLRMSFARISSRCSSGVNTIRSSIVLSVTKMPSMPTRTF